MMRNLPPALTRSALLDLLAEQGFSRLVDFLYLPTDFGSGNSAGFAFVNLVSPQAAACFREHFQRFARWGMRSRRTCNLSWARDDQQGLVANIRPRGRERDRWMPYRVGALVVCRVAASFVGVICASDFAALASSSKQCSRMRSRCNAMACTARSRASVYIRMPWARCISRGAARHGALRLARQSDQSVSVQLRRWREAVGPDQIPTCKVGILVVGGAKLFPIPSYARASCGTDVITPM